MYGICFCDYEIPASVAGVESVFASIPGFAVPDGFQSQEQFCTDFKRRSGLDLLYVGNRDSAPASFATLLEKFFSRGDVDPSELAAIIHTDHQNAFVSPGVHVPYLLQGKFLMKNALVFNVDLGCVGTFLAMDLARGLLENRGKYVVILSSCFSPDLASRYDDYTMAGDGVGVLVLTREETIFDITDIDFLSDGKYSYEKSRGVDRGVDMLNVLKTGADFVRRFLARNGTTPSEIAKVIPQSIHRQVYERMYAKMFGIKPEKFFLENIPKGGHLGDIDIIRNLKDFCDENPLPAKSKVLLYGIGSNGVDISYSAALFSSNIPTRP
jgi:3-oxoacyl-[acyl-carrier-protein] synthase III